MIDGKYYHVIVGGKVIEGRYTDEGHVWAKVGSWTVRYSAIDGYKEMDV